MRVLFLTRYSATGPSSRYRVVQFLPFLDAAGIAYEVHPLLDDRYLSRRFAGRRVSPGYLAARALERVLTLLRSRRFDVIFVQKELFPSVPALAEWLLARGRTPVVLDLDDAIHLPYRGRRLLADKIPRAIAAADGVLAGNAWLAEYARAFNPNTRMFPTVVDAARFTPASQPAGRAVPVLGWMGSPETTRYLADVAPALRSLAARRAFELRVVGGGAARMEGVNVSARPWTFDSEAQELRGFDVGIMPLPDDEWARGKCSLKLLQYMSAGLATVSSPRGSVADIVHDGENGFVAATEADWVARLGALVDDAALRARVGARAREWLVSHYSLEHWGPRFVAVLRAAARGEDVRDA